ncbi:MAG: hypothetical protein KGH65_01275 [Candidatus Micrarchaeota archaeon]|nr:hypothetical protein [Candidatus Micrarchaeota archaeon]
MSEEQGISAETMSFVKTIDKQIGEKYLLGLQDVITDPDVVAKKPNAKEILAGMKADTNAYFDSLLKNLEDESKRFNAELEGVSALYKQISEHIQAKAQSANVPVIKPVSVEREISKEETIVVSTDDTAIELLLARLIGASTYIADLSTSYKTYTIGSWLFSGSKNYNLSLNPPSSVILNIEASRDEINFRIDGIAARF